MNRIVNFFSLIAVLFFSSSCEKVIDVNIKNAEPLVVIEAEITNLPGPYYVLISQSMNFNDLSRYTGIENADVVMTDDVGNCDTLITSYPGLYVTNTIKGVEGRTYTLTVTVNKKSYRSTCKMPFAVVMDTLIAQVDPTTNSGYSLTPVYHDPANVANFYRFRAYEGQSPLKQLIRVRKDGSTNGQIVEQPIGFENYFNPGDTATLNFMCIDENVYQYFFGLSQTLSTGLNAPASPGNPPSNFTNGCLGYFSANTLQSKTIVIQ